MTQNLPAVLALASAALLAAGAVPADDKEKGREKPRGPVPLTIDLADVGLVPNREEAAEANGDAIQRALDEMARRVASLEGLPWNVGDDLIGTLLVPTDGVYHVDRPLFADGQVRITSRAGGRAVLQAVRNSPLIVLGQDVRKGVEPKGLLAGIAFREAIQTTRFVDFSRVVRGVRPSIGYNLRDVSIMPRSTPFDLGLEGRACLAVSAIYRSQADAREHRGFVLWEAGPHKLEHTRRGLELRLETADRRIRTFRLPTPVADGTTYRVLLQVDLEAGRAIGSVDGRVAAVDLTEAGRDFAAGGLRLRAVPPTSEAYLGGRRRYAEANPVDLLGLKFSEARALDPAARPGSPSGVADATLVGATDPADFAVLPPSERPLAGYARVRIGGIGGWAVFRPNTSAPRVASHFELEGLILAGCRREPYGQAVLHLKANETRVRRCSFRYGARGYDEPGAVQANWSLRLLDCEFFRNGSGGLVLGPTIAFVERCAFQYTGPFAVASVGGGTFRDLVCVEAGSEAPIRVTGDAEMIILTLESCSFPNEVAIPPYQVHVTRTPANARFKDRVLIRDLKESGSRRASILLDCDPPVSREPGVCRIESHDTIPTAQTDGTGWAISSDDPLAPAPAPATNLLDPDQPTWSGYGKLGPRPAPDPESPALAGVADFWAIPSLAGHYRAEDQGPSGTAASRLVDHVRPGARRPGRTLEARGGRPAATVALHALADGREVPVLRFDPKGLGYRNPAPPARAGGFTVIAAGPQLANLFATTSETDKPDTLRLAAELPRGTLPPTLSALSAEGPLQAVALRYDPRTEGVDFFLNGQFVGGTFVGPGYRIADWLLGFGRQPYRAELAEAAVFLAPLTDAQIRKAHYRLAAKYAIAW